METNLSTSLQGKNASSSSSILDAAGGSPSDLFTKLLVAQIRNQNPLEPSDPSQFVNQLSQLSQMESLQKLASQSSTNANMMESLQTLALGAQVGSQVSVRTDRINLGSQPVQGSFTLQSATSQATLILNGEDGREHRIALGTQTPGQASFSIDPVKHGLPQGVYAMRIETDAKEAPAIEISGKLTSVKLSPINGVMLDVMHVGEVSSTAITQFNGNQTI